MMAVVLSLYSCRNEDFANQENNPKRNNADFFKYSSSGGVAARAGVDYVNILEAYNDEHNFLATMPDQQGMPIWEKMQVLDVNNYTALYVPLSENGTNLSSVMLVSIDENNEVSALRDYTNDYLYNYVYNIEYSKEMRKFLMDTFLFMDFLTFQNQRFTNLPTDLYEGVGSVNSMNILNVQQQTLNNGKFLYQTVCITFHACANNCSLSSCDYSNCQHGGKCYVVESCSTSSSWEDDPTGNSLPGDDTPGDGGGGVGTGTGSGPTNPGPQPPRDPCASATVFYRLMPGCGGGGELPILDDPCEKTKAMLENPAVQTKLDSLKNHSTTTGELGFKIKKDGTTSDIIDGGEHEVDLGSMTGWQGAYHNHTSTGIPMHSPPDIDNGLLKLARSQPTQPVGEHNNAYFGMIVKKVCSTCTGGFKIYHYVIRFNGTYTDAITNFSKEDLDNFNIRYQTRYGLNKPENNDMNHEQIEKFFFKAIKDMGLEDKIILQRVDNGTVYTIIKNNDGTTTEVPCP